MTCRASWSMSTIRLPSRSLAGSRRSVSTPSRSARCAW
ncbi:Uncharacterised protein [Bordetella pertussis]|nr:Uncharacterised protein [Bordetella pertussis]